METIDNEFDLICLPESAYCRDLVQRTLDIIGNKWAVPVILILRARTRLRNSELKLSIQGISAKELAKQLRNLEEAGLIGRQVYPTIPPRVEYWLTDLGHSLHPIVASMARWSAEHGLQINTNKLKFSEKHETVANAHRKFHRLS